MNALILAVFHLYGYPALWLIVFLAAAGAPISGNLLLYAAGAFAAFGGFNIFVLFFVAVSAAVLGDNLGYFIGWHVGTPLLVWLEKQKRFRFITPDSIANSRTYFRRRAGLAIFLTRFLILVLGGPLNLLAGMERYSYRKFLFWDVCGQVLGAIIPLSIGYIFATSWGKVDSILGDFSSVLLVVLVGIVISVLVIRRIRSRKRAHTEEASGPCAQIEQKARHDTNPLKDNPLVRIEESAKIRLQTRK